MTFSSKSGIAITTKVKGQLFDTCEHE